MWARQGTCAALRAQVVAWVPSLPRRICQLYSPSSGTGTLLTRSRMRVAMPLHSGEQCQSPAHAAQSRHTPIPNLLSDVLSIHPEAVCRHYHRTPTT